MKKSLFIITLILGCTIKYDLIFAQQFTSEEQEVLKVVNLFFQSMTERDTTTAKSILTDDGQYYAMRQDPDSIFQRTISHQEYFTRLGARKDLVQERIWSPTVMVHKLIAIVWAPYDIYVNGDFLHCGVDTFSLIKSNEGWKIAGMTFTMEPEGCEASPLGPIK